MRKYSFIPFVVLVASGASPTLAAEIPPGLFSISDATIGVTTIVDVQKTYGAAVVSRAEKQDGADIRICYASPSAKGKSFLTFESGVMGGHKQITGFRVSNTAPDAKCAATSKDLSMLKTENGVRLGLTLAEFMKMVPVEFKRHGSELVHESVGKRAATQQELKKLRETWPNEKQDYFDVTTTIGATFRNDRLIEFYVRKIESY